MSHIDKAEFGHNQIIGSIDNYMIVLDWETDEFFYFHCPAAEDLLPEMLGMCVEKEILSPISENEDSRLQNFLQKV